MVLIFKNWIIIIKERYYYKNFAWEKAQNKLQKYFELSIEKKKLNTTRQRKRKENWKNSKKKERKKWNWIKRKNVKLWENSKQLEIFCE